MDSEHPYDVVVAVASWSVRSTPVRTVRVWGLVGDIVLCSWAGTLYSHGARSFHPGVQMGTDEFNPGGNPEMD